MRVGRWLLLVLIMLVAVRLALPWAVESYVNRKLNAAKEYGGRIGDVSMQLWHGGYRIYHIEIFKRSGAIHTPFFAAKEMELSVEWRELFHGSVVGEAILHQPRLNFVVGPTEAETQNGKEVAWDKMFESLFPFKFNRVEVANGEIHFQDPHSTPSVDIYTSQISAIATNLTNARAKSEKLPSTLRAQATTLGGGRLDLDLKMNVMKPMPAFELNCGLTNVNLTSLNSFLRAYGKFDVERGDFALFTSIAGNEGKYEGYFKVFFNDLDVFEWQKERKKNVLEVFWQAVVGSVTQIFKNHSKDQLATKVPVTGSYNGSSVGVWTTVTTILQNAFVHALTPKLDEHVNVEKVEQDTGKK